MALLWDKLWCVHLPNLQPALDFHSSSLTIYVGVCSQVDVPPSNYNDRVHTVLDSGSVLTYMEDVALGKLHEHLQSHCQQGANPVCEGAKVGSEGFSVRLYVRQVCAKGLLHIGP